MTPAAVPDSVLEQFLRLISPWRPEIKRILLFGSRAREKAGPESDYDLLIVVSKRERPLIRGLYGAVVDMLLASGKDISLKIFEQAEFDRLSKIPTPFMKNVLREGVVLG